MTHAAPLDWLNTQHGDMVSLVERWARINSGSSNLAGLAAMQAALREEFSILGGEIESIPLSPMHMINSKGEIEHQQLGQALRIRKRPEARKQIFLGGHMDTVFGIDHPFQSLQYLDNNTLNGPGVADMKGGLAIMLFALMALERSPHAQDIGWEVLINSDEEIGSHGSAPLLAEAAARNDFGLIFEPALAGGMLVSHRKGTGNFSVVIHGRAAHSGRNPEEGRNAIVQLAELISQLNALNGHQPGTTINPGHIEGGGPVNIVPDLAILHFNVRIGTHEEQHWVECKLQELIAIYNKREGYRAELHGGFTRGPKILTDTQHQLHGIVSDCGAQLGMELSWGFSGGCCDGNNLATHGLPNVDSLGVVGGAIHSADEFLKTESLTERAQLSALLLMRYAAGEVNWNPRRSAA